MSSGGIPYDPSTYRPDDEPTSHADQVMQRHLNEFMSIRGVEGCMVGSGPAGDEAIIVLARDSSVRRRVPKSVEGVDIIVEPAGPIDAL